MGNKAKGFLALLMGIALAAGYLDGLTGTGSFRPERLHIFLFNLCSGGTILIYYSERLSVVSKKAFLFLIVSIIYAFSAFLELYSVTLAASLFLMIIVEYVREKRYPVFPVDFFSPKVSVSEKFNHAALLCLFIGLIIASLVIINNNYLNLVSVSKLQLDVFFLGFSFPLSLITMSVMFQLMEKENLSQDKGGIKNACFWAVNLGVIVFFVFILMNVIIPQVIVTAILFIAVLTVFILFVRSVGRLQQKTFLVSGMLFLVYTAVTGILYIVLHFFPETYDKSAGLLIRLHALAALYGWNLSGLAVIARFENFPLRFHSVTMVSLHWFIVALLVPLGYYYILFAFIAVPAYFIFLLILFFSKGENKGAGDADK